MIRKRISAITTAESVAVVTMKPVCCRQSASAADVVLVATMTSGKCVSDAAEPSFSSPSIGPLMRSVCRPPSVSILLHQRRVAEILADQLFDMRVACQHLAFAVEQRDGRAFGERDGGEIAVIIVGIDPAHHDAEESAVRHVQPSCDDRGPFADQVAANGFQQHRLGSAGST